MKEYIMKLNRNIGIGKDLENYLRNRGCIILYNNQEVAPRTLLIKAELNIEELTMLKYVENVVEAPVGSINV